jgi:hypothetical protein
MSRRRRALARPRAGTTRPDRARVSRFLLYMQIAIVVFVLAGAVIALTKIL